MTIERETEGQMKVSHGEGTLLARRERKGVVQKKGRAKGHEGLGITVFELRRETREREQRARG